MKNNIFEYKGYHTIIEFDTETCTLRGKIEGIDDFVNFESKDVSKIESEFHDAVDDYLEFCNEVGKSPDKVYKGIFNVRINPILHKKAALLARKGNESLNKLVENAIEAYVEGTTKTEVKLCETVTTLSRALVAKNSYESLGVVPRINTESIGKFSAYGNLNMQYTH